MYKGSLFFTSLSTLNISCLWWSPSLHVWGDSSLWSWFAFTWWFVTLISFSCMCWPFGCLLWTDVYLVFCPFFDWISFFLLGCMSSLYIFLWVVKVFYKFWIFNPLSDTWFVKFFSQPFDFVACFFCWAEAFKFDVVPFVDFLFCCLRFWWDIHKIIPKINVEEPLPYVFF